jgi:group I intron endonuclease
VNIVTADSFQVYKATCTVNGKCYIGITRNLQRRIIEHRYASKRLSSVFHKALQKYGFENFTWEIVHDKLVLSDALEVERNLIESHQTHYLTGNGYNMTAGGEGNHGYVYTDEARAKMREAQARRGPRPKTSDETKQKISLANKGVPKPEGCYQTPEYRAAQSERMKQLWADPVYRAAATQKVKDFWMRKRQNG